MVKVGYIQDTNNNLLVICTKLAHLNAQMYNLQSNRILNMSSFYMNIIPQQFSKCVVLAVMALHQNQLGLGGIYQADHAPRGFIKYTQIQLLWLLTHVS